MAIAAEAQQLQLDATSGKQRRCVALGFLLWLWRQAIRQLQAAGI